MTKKELRELASSIRDNISKDKREKATETILQKAFKEIKDCKMIGIYETIKSEVDTKALFTTLEYVGMKSCVPVIKDGVMTMSSPDVDALIIPGLGFDDDNNRLGYGKGYYDKFLKTFKGKKIMIAFKGQKIKSIPAEAHDVKMDMVITD